MLIFLNNLILKSLGNDKMKKDAKNTSAILNVLVQKFIETNASPEKIYDYLINHVPPKILEDIVNHQPPRYASLRGDGYKTVEEDQRVEFSVLTPRVGK